MNDPTMTDQAGRPWWKPPPEATRTAGWALLPLRLFLGITYCYAGLQKLANPQFLNNASPISIHAQLLGVEHSSPIHGLVSTLVQVAPAVGLLIAVGELAVGIGVLVGLWTRIAALGGMAISLGLFLTVSYHSSPYFTGSDIVFFFAWTPLLIAGAGGAPAIDTRLERLRARDTGLLLQRRAILVQGTSAGMVALAVVITGGLTAWIGRLVGHTTTEAEPGVDTISTTTTTLHHSSGSTTTSGQANPPGHLLGAASDVPVKGASQFTDPVTGDPGLVLQPTAGDFVAFDAICPHAGCTVQFAQSSDIIVCPCHGSEFNARTGALVRGPATRGLTPITVALGSDGDLYVDG